MSTENAVKEKYDWTILYTVVVNAHDRGNEETTLQKFYTVSPDKKSAILKFLCNLELTRFVELYSSKNRDDISDDDIEFLMSIPNLVHHLDLDGEIVDVDTLQEEIACGVLDYLSPDDFLSDNDAERFMNIVLNVTGLNCYFDDKDPIGCEIEIDDIIKHK